MPQINIRLQYSFTFEYSFLIQKMEVVAKSYYKAILTDANAMIDKYMSLVKNFPVVFNGSKVKQTIENLMNQLNKVSF